MTYPPTQVIPTQAGFLTWVRDFMGVTTQWLPDNSDYISYAYDTAVAIVHPVFMEVPGPIYLQMVYNLAGHLLATWAPDPATPPCYVEVDDVCYGFWAYLRKTNNMLGFTTGIVQASSDEGTSVSLVVPEHFKNLTMSQLQLTTSPWGRTYLGYAADWGPSNWGIS